MKPKTSTNPMRKAHEALRCGAKTRGGGACRGPAMRGKQRCRMHGGRAGAPRGKANGAYRHGLFTAEAIEESRALRKLLREGMELLAILPCEGSHEPRDLGEVIGQLQWAELAALLLAHGEKGGGDTTKSKDHPSRDGSGAQTLRGRAGIT